jgi:four helix bundle protein
MRNFREFTIWKQGVDLAVRCYEIGKQLPKEEVYGLRSQINRAAVSIPSNIAKGCGRSGKKDFKRFLEISLSSSYELETGLVIIQRVGLIKSAVIDPFLKDLQIEQRQINSMINRTGN